jgi:hypothetical protein
MIVEVCSSRIKPGRLDEFIQFFEPDVVPAGRGHCTHVFGPFFDVENLNKLV